MDIFYRCNEPGNRHETRGANEIYYAVRKQEKLLAISRYNQQESPRRSGLANLLKAPQRLFMALFG